jgi:hypothetical protein
LLGQILKGHEAGPPSASTTPSRNPRQRCWTLGWLQIAKQLAAFPSYILLNRTVLSVRNEAKGVQYQTLATPVPKPTGSKFEQKGRDSWSQEVSRRGFAEDLEPTAASPTPNMAARAITEEDVRMFREDGYCICPHFFST